MSTDAGGEVTLSVGVAIGPEHAMNARELFACAEAAMMTAKAQGKDRVVVFEDLRAERPLDGDGARDLRSIAYLKLLQSLAQKLGRLNDVTQIGEAIVDELRMLVDYHNCIVYLLEGRRLLPVAVRGQLESEGFDRLEFQLGEGLTGHVAETGKPMLVANVLESDICIQLTEGAGDESLASVPLRHGQRVIGAITMSKLGVGQFDDDDLRLLEVVAGHASVALENARLYESARREAENATAWLEFSDALSEARSVEAVGDETVSTIGRVMEVEQASIWIEDAEAGNFRCLASLGYDDDPRAAAVPGLRTTRATAVRLIGGSKTPFTIGAAEFREVLGEDAGNCRHQLGGDRAARRRLRHPRLDHRAGSGRRPGPLHRRAAAPARRPRLPRLGRAAEDRAAPVRAGERRGDRRAARVLAPAGRHGRGRPAWADRRAGRRDARLVADVAVARAGPAGDVRDRGVLARGRRPADRSRSGASSSSPARARRSSAGRRSSWSPAPPTWCPPGTTRSRWHRSSSRPGRIGCIAATVPEAFPEPKLRLLAGIANQASLALHISLP